MMWPTGYMTTGAACPVADICAEIAGYTGGFVGSFVYGLVDGLVDARAGAGRPELLHLLQK